jgi:hypothetical protein
MTPEEKALRDLRRVGLGLLLAGALASTVLESIAKQRHRVNEARRKALLRVETPGSLLTQAGVAILEGTSRKPSSG